MKPSLFLKKISWAGRSRSQRAESPEAAAPTALLLICGGVRPTSGCISTNTHWIPQIHKTLAGRKEIKVWKHSCVLGSPVRAPKDINHGFRGGWSAGKLHVAVWQKKVLCSVWLRYSALLGSISKLKFYVQKLVNSLCFYHVCNIILDYQLGLRNIIMLYGLSMETCWYDLKFFL